nr:hypothetical protein [Sphaerochaetaceae bacterium]
WSFIPYYVDNITSLSIPSDVLKSLSISLEGYMNFPSNNQFLEVGFSFVPGANITAKTDVYLDFVDGKGLSAVSVYENLSTSFKISKSLTLSPSMRLTNLNYSSYSLSDRVWLYRAGVTLSGGQINRVSSGEDYYAFRDNFRTGIKLDAEARILWNNIFSSSVSDPDLIARAAVTAFFMPTKTFNPSFRFYVAGAVDAIKWFNQYSGSYYAVANLYTFSDYTMTPSTLNSIVRGVRLDNEEIDGGGYESRFMGYFSANLTTAFLYFEEFGHLYVSPFIDAVVFTTEFGDDTELISGVGLEGYLIMDSHASYPIRASLGFNLESIIDKFKGGTDPLEYELFIGLNFLY